MFSSSCGFTHKCRDIKVWSGLDTLNCQTKWMLLSVYVWWPLWWPGGLPAFCNNVCWNNLQLLITLRGIQQAENTNVSIFAKTNDYNHFSQVNLFLAGFTLHFFTFLFSGSFIFCCPQSISNHIAIRCKTLPKSK